MTRLAQYRLSSLFLVLLATSWSLLSCATEPELAWAQADGEGSARDGDPPVEGTSASSEQIEFEEKLASPDPEEWVRALGSLTPYFMPNQTPPSWVKKALTLHLVKPLADENPARTRKILRDRTMVEQPVPCEEILLELLAKDPNSYGFLPEVEATLADVAADTKRRPGLLASLRAPGENEQVVFPRLLLIIARHDPQAAVREAMARLQVEAGSESDEMRRVVKDALEDLLGVEWADAKACLEWWAESRRLPIPEFLRNQERTRGTDELIQLWKRAAEYLFPNKSAFREFLLDSLQRTPEIQLVALREVVKKIPSNFEGENVLLAPFVDRLLQIAEDEDASNRLREEAMEALGGFRDFGEHPSLVEALGARIDKLGTASVAPENDLDGTLSVAAIHVAGKLEAPLALKLGRALENQLELVESEWDWPAEKDELVLALLNALARIGPKAETLDAVEHTFRSRVPADEARAAKRVQAHELAVRLMGKWNPQDAGDAENARVLAFLTEALKRRDVGQVRTRAIIGIGNLRLVDGLAPLQEVVLGGGEPGNRSEAVSSIYTIGRLPAVKCFRRLLAELSAEDSPELREQILSRAKDLCLKDPVLEYVAEYLFPSEERTPGFELLVDDPDFARLIDPEHVPLDELQKDGVFRRWASLRREVGRLLLERAEAAGPESEVAAYRKLAASAQQALDFVESHEELAKLKFSYKQEIERFVALGQRESLIEALAKSDYTALLSALESQAEAGQAVGRDQILWVLLRLEKTARTRPESRVPAEFLEGIEQLQKAKELDLGEDWERVREVLRAKPSKVVESTAPDPEPPSGAGTGGL